jgi:hypothetical protein
VDACSAFVSWARTHGTKVNIAVIAINAGPNGRETTCSNFAACAGLVVQLDSVLRRQ